MATLNPNLRDFWETPARNRVLYGGRSSSKSWDAAGVSLFATQAQTKKVMCVRQFQNRITDSVYTLLKNRIKDFGFSSAFTVKTNTIECNHNDSSFVFYGLWRHIDEIKSAEGIDILWIEEAHNLTKAQWTILEPTIRKEGSQVWIIFNPKLISDYAYKRFILNPPPNTIIRKINYDENPFLSETMRRIIEDKREEDEDEYRHIYLGEPKEDSDRVIIKRSWVMAAIDAHKKLDIEPEGRAQAGFDVADDGDDKNAECLMRGIVCTHIDQWVGLEDELLKSAGRVHRLCVVNNAEVAYDSIGIGAFAGSHFRSLNDDKEIEGKINYHKFNASGAILRPKDLVNKDDKKGPINKDFFCNLKAQVWWDVAKRFKNTFNYIEKGIESPYDDLISISSDIKHLDKLVDELSSPYRDADKAGKTKVESKDDMKKRGLESPNLADSFIMANAPIELIGKKVVRPISGRTLRS